MGCTKTFAQYMDYQETIEENSMGFYTSLLERDVIAIEKYLKSDGSPDYCSNKLIWDDRNPLWLILNGEKKDVDLDIIKLLIDAGANVNLRPYIWHTLDHRILTEEDIAWMQAAKGRIVTGTTIDLMYKKIDILLQAGADVNRKGAPNRQLFPSTDDNYMRYFEREGTTPLNYAIKKNLPLIVDLLLLQYTKLDENSLIAADESNDPAMIEKINNLWKMQ